MENTWEINLYLRLKNGGFHQASVYLIYENTSMITQQTCWSNQMETFSALLPIWNSPVTGEFPAQRPMAQSSDVFFDLHVDKRLSKQK